MIKPYVLLCLIILLFGCSVNEIETLPSTSNEMLDSLLAGAPYSFVDLDRVSVDTLIIERENILGLESDPSLMPPGLLRYIGDMITIGDSLYVADNNPSQIWVINSSGEIVRSIGRSGSGPGEFSSLGGLKRNSNFVFAADAQLLRVTVFDMEFNIVTYMDHLSVSGDANQFVATDSLIFLPARDAEATNLIRYYQATPPFEETGTFFPRIIPLGMGPSVLNFYSFHANLNSVSEFQHVTANVNLPYLFLYDEHLQHVRTLVLQGAVYDELDQPSPEPQPVSVTGPFAVAVSGFSSFIGHMVLADDGSLLVGTRNPFTLYHIVPDGTDDHVKSAWRLAFENPVNGTVQSLDQIDDLFLDSNTLYLSRAVIPYVFRIDL